jgi:acetoacetate decarboxylase
MRPDWGHAFPVPSRNAGLSGSKTIPVKGSLKKTQFGFSMPLSALLFPRPPFLYKDATLMIFEYETELEVAAGLLPEVDGLFLNDDPHTSGAWLVFASYPWSNLGHHEEVVLYLRVLDKGQPMQYAAFRYVTSDAVMAAGPEMGGYPKKIGRIAFLSDSDYAAGLERPAGLRLGSGTMPPEQLLDPETLPFHLPRPLPLDYLTLRVIPSPQLDAPPTVLELLETHWSVEGSEAWAGPGSGQLISASALDPLHLAPIKAPRYSRLLKGNINVSLNDRPSVSPL